MSTTPNFDTLAAVETLTERGFDRVQAKSIVETIKESQTELATKRDLESAILKITVGVALLVPVSIKALDIVIALLTKAPTP